MKSKGEPVQPVVDVSGESETVAVEAKHVDTVGGVESSADGKGKNRKRKKNPKSNSDPESSEKGKPVRERMTTFEKNARDWFNDPCAIPKLVGLPKTEEFEAKLAAPNRFFPIWEAGRIARAQGRPLNLNEVQRLVVKDGEVSVCSWTGTEFQPVKFLQVNRHLLELLGKKRLEDIPEHTLRYDGVYFAIAEPSNPDHKKKVVGCGSVWWPKRFSNDFCPLVLNERSPLAILMRSNASEKDIVFWQNRQRVEIQRREQKKPFDPHVIMSPAHRAGLPEAFCDRIIKDSVPWGASVPFGDAIARMFGKDKD